MISSPHISLLREVITDWSRDTREWKINVGDAEAALRDLEEQLEAFRSALDEIAHTPSGRQKAATLEGYIEADGVMRTIARNALDAVSSPATSPSYDFAGSAPDGHAPATQSAALGEGNDPASGADE